MGIVEAFSRLSLELWKRGRRRIVAQSEQATEWRLVSPFTGTLNYGAIWPEIIFRAPSWNSSRRDRNAWKFHRSGRRSSLYSTRGPSHWFLEILSIDSSDALKLCARSSCRIANRSFVVSDNLDTAIDFLKSRFSQYKTRFTLSHCQSPATQIVRDIEKNVETPGNWYILFSTGLNHWDPYALEISPGAKTNVCSSFGNFYHLIAESIRKRLSDYRGSRIKYLAVRGRE